jgi:glycosyltransferase involved in cell wall biosynthesis
MAPYLEVVRQSDFDGLALFDNYNAEAALQHRIFEVDLRTPLRWHAALYSFIQWRRLIAFETHVCAQADHVLAVSGLDAQLLGALKHETPVSVIPNAIDVASYRLDGTPDDLLARPSLVFTGKMDYRPNVDAALWFAAEVLPRVQSQVPEAHFAIVGQKPHARLAPLHNRPDITITGAVDNIRPYIAAADVYVVPMRMGSGTRFKVLEAMAMERAIVSTTLGAQGLDAESGSHLLVADTPAAFADAIAALLNDDARRASLGQSAIKLVSEGYDWGRIVPRLEAIYEQA